MDVNGDTGRCGQLELIDAGRSTPSLTINAHPYSYVYVGDNGHMTYVNGSHQSTSFGSPPPVLAGELNEQSNVGEHQKQCTIGEESKQVGLSQEDKQIQIAILKAKYKDMYQKHVIHVVDRKERISVQEVKVTDFAVRLHISNDLPPKGSFRDEAQHHFQNLKYFTGDNFELSDLIDDDKRITYIRGIAGMGKSVLTKQLVCGWANGEMYKDFRFCVMFECRDLNYFKATKGASLEDHEMFSEFVKEKVNCDLGDGEGVLFVVDGLDELYDIKNDRSVIQQLVNRKISMFRRSKIIITGRPHVENKLEGYGVETGGLRKVEILGLDDGQINEYIEKFSLSKEQKSYIYKAKRSSKPLLIVHVPQFLNTFCCIAILMKGKVISDPTELYCWTLYFLLRQHADKSNETKKTLPQIFQEYAESLKALGKVCHDLLEKNQIILDGEIQSLLSGNESGNKFIQSLFVDVSDNLNKMYQFKHLSLMEFLSALHICGVDNRIDIIKTNLENGWIETVSFACRLIAGMSSPGIIKETLTNVNKVANLKSKQFLKNVLDHLHKCKLDDKAKLKKSLEIVGFFLNKKFRDKKLLLKLLAGLRHKVFESNFMDSKNIMEICDHLVKVCNCSEAEIRNAVKNVRFGWFVVNDVNVLGSAKHFESIELLELRDCKFDTTVLRRSLEDKVFKGCKVGVVGCEFIDKRAYVSKDQSVGRIDRLLISGCRIDKVGFGNLCELGMSSGKFQLLGLDISNQWWKELAELIENRVNRPGFFLTDLEANKCTTELDKDVRMKIIQCGVTLKIDGIVVNPDSTMASSTCAASSRPRCFKQHCSTSPVSCVNCAVPPQLPADHAQQSRLSGFLANMRTTLHRISSADANNCTLL